MLVGERMSQPVITISPDAPISEALALMNRENIRRMPVIGKGKLVGIVSEKALLNASPSSATSLSMWELNYLLSKITVKDVMSRTVFTVSADTPIEEAARIMVDNQVGGLPVMRAGEVVGMITETDLFKVFLELMGARDAGVRVAALVPDRHGELAALAQAVTDAGGDFISLGTFEGQSPENRLLTFKIAGLSKEKVQELIKPLVLELYDIRG
jgi:acetoin utilization protein AcuB